MILQKRVARELRKANEANLGYVKWVEKVCNKILGRSDQPRGNIHLIREKIKDCQRKLKLKHNIGRIDGVVGFRTDRALLQEAHIPQPMGRSKGPVASIPELTKAEIQVFTRTLLGSRERPAAFIDDERNSQEEIKNLLLTEMDIYKIFQAIAEENFPALIWNGVKKEIKGDSFSSNRERNGAIVNYFAGMAYTLIARGKILEIGNSPGSCRKRVPSISRCQTPFENGQKHMRDRIDELRDNPHFKKGIDSFFARIQATKNKASLVRGVHQTLMKMYLQEHQNEKSLRKRANCGNFRFPNFPVNGLTCTKFRKL